MTADVVSPAENDEALRKRLLSRIAVAGVAIVGLLGGLAVFDFMQRPAEPALPKMAAIPEPVAEPAKEEGKVAEHAQDAPAQTQEEADKEADAAVKPPPVAEGAPERSETPFAPPQGGKPLTQPAVPRQAAIRPSEPAIASVKPDARREIPRAVPETTRPAQAAASAPPSRPLSRASESSQRLLLQVGVFSNHANAEELVQRLQAAGIPAQIESRVQVGPFATRAEADAARAKLKELGIDDSLLVRR